MKVNPLADAIRFFGVVREKSDRNQQQKQNPQDRRGKDDQEQEPDSEARADSATIGRLDDAIQGFQADADTQANHLSVSKAGSGPGLKVVLKDGNGAVVRQFTGEEFIRLREAVSKDGRSRGKILDRKL